jgi:hypothetical protein
VTATATEPTPTKRQSNPTSAIQRTGQALHFDPSVADNTIASNGGVTDAQLLARYYALPSFRPAVTLPFTRIFQQAKVRLPGMCGWTNSIAYRGDDQNTEFDALQITLAQQFSKGLAITGNYQWASAFDRDSRAITRGATRLPMDGTAGTRDQQLTAYGSYDFPFGKGQAVRIRTPTA